MNLQIDEIVIYFLSMSVVVFDGFYHYYNDRNLGKLFLRCIPSLVPTINTVVALILATFVIIERYSIDSKR